MTFTALISDNDDIIDCNKWHFNRFLNPCLFDRNKWHFNRFPNACLNTYVNPGSVAQFDFHQSDNSNVSFPLISFLSSSDLMDSERVWYFMTSGFITSIWPRISNKLLDMQGLQPSLHQLDEIILVEEGHVGLNVNPTILMDVYRLQGLLSSFFFWYWLIW